MSGVATLTRRMVAAVSHTHTRILDTRKTLPGLRVLEKLAVLMGGGTNHRFGLFDMILIKDNHVTASGGIEAALHRTHQFLSQHNNHSSAVTRGGVAGGVIPIEVETRTIEE